MESTPLPYLRQARKACACLQSHATWLSPPAANMTSSSNWPPLPSNCSHSSPVIIPISWGITCLMALALKQSNLIASLVNDPDYTGIPSISTVQNKFEKAPKGQHAAWRSSTFRAWAQLTSFPHNSQALFFDLYIPKKNYSNQVIARQSDKSEEKNTAKCLHDFLHILVIHGTASWFRYKMNKMSNYMLQKHERYYAQIYTHSLLQNHATSIWLQKIIDEAHADK